MKEKRGFNYRSRDWYLGMEILSQERRRSEKILDEILLTSSRYGGISRWWWWEKKKEGRRRKWRRGLDSSIDLGSEVERSPRWSTTHYYSLLVEIAAENDVDVITRAKIKRPILTQKCDSSVKWEEMLPSPEIVTISNAICQNLVHDAMQNPISLCVLQEIYKEIA